MVARQPGWVRVEGVSLAHQRGTRDCGAAALSTVLEHWQQQGGHQRGSVPEFRSTEIDRALRIAPERGLAAGDLRDYARARGFPAFVILGTLRDLKHELDSGRPVIVGVHKPLSSGEVLAHYEVVIGYHEQLRQVMTLDPARGLRQNDFEGFAREWASAGRVALVIFPRT